MYATMGGGGRGVPFCAPLPPNTSSYSSPKVSIFLCTPGSTNRHTYCPFMANPTQHGAAVANVKIPNATAFGGNISYTGIVDSHQLMLSYQGDAEDHGAQMAFHTALEAGARALIRVSCTPMPLSITAITLPAIKERQNAQPVPQFTGCVEFIF